MSFAVLRSCRGVVFLVRCMKGALRFRTPGILEIVPYLLLSLLLLLPEILSRISLNFGRIESFFIKIICWEGSYNCG